MIVNRELLAMLDELKPCPFCGGAARVTEAYSYGHGGGPMAATVSCACGCTLTPVRAYPNMTRSAAIAAWTTRAQPQTGGGDQ